MEQVTSSTRRCENWLQTYRDYVLPRTDAPESFVRWSGIFTLAAALRRRVWLPKQYLGLWDCYPFLYVMFVAPPGFRKSTTIRSGSEVLLSQVPELEHFAGPEMFTKEAVLEQMAEAPEASMHLVIDEFSDVMQKAGQNRNGIYEFFTSMFDGKMKIHAKTKTSGNAFLEKPCMNFFTGTTPGWIKENMPEGMIVGGFASRFVIVFETKPRLRQTFFDGVESPDPNRTFPELERDLLLDLMHISSQLAGEFQIEPEALEFIRRWTENEENYKFRNEKMAGYMNRKFTLIAKIAMIQSVSRKDELVLTVDDWKSAINLIEANEAGMEELFGGMGKNRFAVDVKNIISYVVGMHTFTDKPVTYAMILNQFQAAAEPRILKDLISLAVDMRAIRASEKVIDGELHTIFEPMTEGM